MSEGPPDHDEVEAPGWDAIDRWVGGKLPSTSAPHQFTSRTPYELDKPSPLPAITVWPTREPPGWLYVTYGLSELFEKSSNDPHVSGFGFELTLRIPRGDEDTPPRWPLRLLHALGHHVLTHGKGFDSGHTMNLGGPIVPPGADGPRECALVGFACVPDPLLGKIETVNGSLLFLRLFGLAADELDVLTQLELAPLVGCVGELDGHVVTDVGRGSWVEDAQKGKILRRYKLGISLE